MQSKRIRQTILLGRQSLIFGIIVLIICSLIGNLLQDSTSPALQIFSTGLTILGWVAFWRPVETLIFGWWPQYQLGRVLRRLARVSVELLRVSQV